MKSKTKDGNTSKFDLISKINLERSKRLRLLPRIQNYKEFIDILR
jgi:hypothetical protein